MMPLGLLWLKVLMKELLSLERAAIRCSGSSLSLMRKPLPSWFDHAGFRADNDDVYLLSEELEEEVARLHISAYVEPLKQKVRIRASVPLHLQLSTATHIVTHTRRAACYHSQVHPHKPRSRGVGTPGVICTTDYLLRDCGSVGAPAPGNGCYVPGRRGVGC